jgi:hypothetical protein
VLLPMLGCLDMLGDVNVDPVGTSVEPNLPGSGGDCPDAGRAAGTCVVSCEPGVPRCGDNLLQRCNDAGDGWILIDQCASAALCDVVALQCVPPTCGARENRCTEDGALQVCNAERTGFTTVEQCRSAAFCSATPGRTGCEAECRAGRQRCNGPQIEVCRADRSGFDLVGEPCASAALCVEADVARCEVPVCVPGVFACDGALLSRCSDEANRFIGINQCDTPELCLAAEQRCADPSCEVGAQRCSGNVLERCNAARNGFAPVETCSSALLCDPTAPQCLTSPPANTLPDPSVLDGEDYDFVDATSAAVAGIGPMRLEVPEQWSDVDRSPWTNAAGTAIGPRFIASTDAARFSRNFDIPGVYFAATAQAPLDVATRLREFDLSTRCAASVTEPYDDELYSGSVQTWTSCGVTSATTLVVVAVDKEDERFVTVVIVTMVADRDDEARDNIWDSFVAD